MIVAGSHPTTSIHLGEDELSMTLQYLDAMKGQTVWRDYTVDGDRYLSRRPIMAQP
ncbi:MAG: hypothetical protein QNK19_13235 [Xanthomonadales bacterium]|nr:hypothetical protein [Xanthomonadales bacterium]